MSGRVVIKELVQQGVEVIILVDPTQILARRCVAHAMSRGAVQSLV